jgi:hypothetical protein
MADIAGRTGADRTGGADMRTSYVRVMISWLLVLAALYAFQEYFA